MPMHAKIREAVERVGPDKVLYGSDAPFHHPAVELSEGARERSVGRSWPAGCSGRMAGGCSGGDDRPVTVGARDRVRGRRRWQA